jgi:hypothetical protein
MTDESCAYLVANSSFHVNSIVKEMNKTDVQMDICLTDISFELSKGIIDKLAGYLNDIDEIYELNSSVKGNNWITNLPTSFKDS